MELTKYTSHHGMIQSFLLFSFFLKKGTSMIVIIKVLALNN